jgi:hypothetical protein
MQLGPRVASLATRAALLLPSGHPSPPSAPPLAAVGACRPGKAWEVSAAAGVSPFERRAARARCGLGRAWARIRRRRRCLAGAVAAPWRDCGGGAIGAGLASSTLRPARWAWQGSIWAVQGLRRRRCVGLCEQGWRRWARERGALVLALEFSGRRPRAGALLADGELEEDAGVAAPEVRLRFGVAWHGSCRSMGCCGGCVMRWWAVRGGAGGLSSPSFLAIVKDGPLVGGMFSWCSGVVSLVRGQREGWEKSLQMPTTATPVGAVTSLEAWSKPFSFCPLPSYGGNPRSSLLDRAAAASRRRSPPWRRCLCCSGSPKLTTGVDVDCYLKHGPRGRNVHWSGISGCRLSQARPGPAVSLADYSFLGAMGGRYVDACHL